MKTSRSELLKNYSRRRSHVGNSYAEALSDGERNKIERIKEFLIDFGSFVSGLASPQLLLLLFFLFITIQRKLNNFCGMHEWIKVGERMGNNIWR